MCQARRASSKGRKEDHLQVKEQIQIARRTCNLRMQMTCSFILL